MPPESDSIRTNQHEATRLATTYRLIESATSRDSLAAQLLDAAPDAMVVVDSAGSMILVNRQTEVLFGYPPDALIGNPVEKLIPEPMRAEHVIRRGMYSDQPRIRQMGRGLELLALHKDGTTFPVEIMLSPLKVDGQVLVSAAIRDITKRKAAEQALRESEQRFALALQHSPVVVFSQDRDLRYTWMYNSHLGVPDKEVLGKTDAELMSPKTAALWMALKRSVLESGKGVRTEVEIDRPTGTRYYDLTIEPQHDADGKIVGITGAGIDITERKNAQARIDEARVSYVDDIVKSNAVRLEAISDKLLTAERMAVLGTMAAGLTHDITNLLFPIRLRLQALGSKHSEIAEEIEWILGCTNYLQQICTGLRLLAAHPEQTEESTTNLTAWWPEIAGLLRNTLPRQVQLTHDLPEGLPEVKLARHLVTQIVFNLVHNAGRAMQSQKGVVRVWATASEDRRTIRLSVTDNGPGMEPEVKRRCLELWFTTNQQNSSGGLGLALVQKITTTASGSIEIESELGQGTTFTVVLPAVQGTSS